MATLATFFDRFFSPRALGNSRMATRETAARTANPYRLRSLPNEDVYFFRKTMDNSRVVRQVDPQAGGTCWRLLGTVGLITLILIGLAAPRTMAMIDGYQIQKLKQEQQILLNERAALELEEARLLRPERLLELAKLQQFIDPGPEGIVHLGPKSDTVALNKLSAR